MVFVPQQDMEGSFEDALKNAKLTHAVFPSQLCEDIGLDAMLDTDIETEQRIRSIMEQAHDPDRFLFQMQSLVQAHLLEAREALRAGCVAAIDGTDALRPVTFMNTTAYAVAIGCVTSQARSNPHIQITTTNAEHIRTRRVKHASIDELGRLCDVLDHGRFERSWPSTFREYHEREVALQSGVPIVLIDGPVWTQDLISQPSGRALYDRMQGSSQKFFGVIKDLRNSWTLSKWCGYSLRTGEGYVIGPVRTQLQTHFSHRGEVTKWIDGLPEEYVRVVFRPQQKAFGLECRLGDLPLAMAILQEDASPTINHELPLLLEIIDAQVRAGFDGALASDAVISRLQQMDYRRAVDVTGERDYR